MQVRIKHLVAAFSLLASDNRRGGRPRGRSSWVRLRNEKSRKNAALVARPGSAACESYVVQCSACLAFARTARACGGGGSCAVGSKHVGTIPAIHVANAMTREVRL